MEPAWGWSRFGSFSTAPRDGGRGDPFGFPWPLPFSSQNQGLQGLDFLGFPWILSSGLRLINGLRGIFAEQKFSRPFRPWRRRRRRGAGGLGMRKRRILHGANLTLFLAFSNQLSSSGPLKPKATCGDRRPRRRRDVAVCLTGLGPRRCKARAASALPRRALRRGRPPSMPAPGSSS
jgi:hypothetical protein